MAVSVDTTVFEFNVTAHADGSNSSDKSYAEILAAHNSGRSVVCVYGAEGDGEHFRIPLIAAMDGVMSFVVAPTTGTYMMCIITSDDSIEAMIGSSTITINGQTWDGDDPVDFTETINTMISEKIPTTPETLPNPNTLTINGVEYDGSSAIDMTEQINVLINNALGVIENGSY